MIDAATIRERLAACKREGMTFENAWRVSVGAVPRGPRRGDVDDEPSAAHFAYLTFRAHYLGEDTTVNALNRDLAAEDHSVTSRGRDRTGRDAA